MAIPKTTNNDQQTRQRSATTASAQLRKLEHINPQTAFKTAQGDSWAPFDLAERVFDACSAAIGNGVKAVYNHTAVPVYNLAASNPYVAYTLGTAAAVAAVGFTAKTIVNLLDQVKTSNLTIQASNLTIQNLKGQIQGLGADLLRQTSQLKEELQAEQLRSSDLANRLSQLSNPDAATKHAVDLVHKQVKDFANTTHETVVEKAGTLMTLIDQKTAHVGQWVQDTSAPYVNAAIAKAQRYLLPTATNFAQNAVDKLGTFAHSALQIADSSLVTLGEFISTGAEKIPSGFATFGAWLSSFSGNSTQVDPSNNVTNVPSPVPVVPSKPAVITPIVNNVTANGTDTVDQFVPTDLVEDKIKPFVPSDVPVTPILVVDQNNVTANGTDTVDQFVPTDLVEDKIKPLVPSDVPVTPILVVDQNNVTANGTDTVDQFVPTDLVEDKIKPLVPSDVPVTPILVVDQIGQNETALNITTLPESESFSPESSSLNDTSSSPVES